MSALAVIGAGGFLRRVGAMLRKELLQLRRDRVTLATMISIPLLQLTLFGYAINTTPRNLPTAVLLQESSDVGRSILAAIQNTKYFKVVRRLRDEADLDEALKSGQVLFAVEIPANFERALRRGDDPALLVATDATDGVASVRWTPDDLRSSSSKEVSRCRILTRPIPPPSRLKPSALSTVVISPLLRLPSISASPIRRSVTGYAKQKSTPGYATG